MKKRSYSGIPVLRQFVGFRPTARRAAAAGGAEATPSPGGKAGAPADGSPPHKAAPSWARDTALPAGGPSPASGTVLAPGADTAAMTGGPSPVGGSAATEERNGLRGSARRPYMATASPAEKSVDARSGSGGQRPEAGAAPASGERAFAFLADTGSVSLPDGGAFPLAGGLYSGGGFAWEPGWVTIRQGGAYLAVFTVSGRTGTAPLPAVGLALEDGAAVGKPARLLAGEDGAVQGTGSAVLEAEPGTRLCLRADGPLLLTGTPAATLTLLREV